MRGSLPHAFLDNLRAFLRGQGWDDEITQCGDILAVGSGMNICGQPFRFYIDVDQRTPQVTVSIYSSLFIAEDRLPEALN